MLSMSFLTARNLTKCLRTRIDFLTCLKKMALPDVRQSLFLYAVCLGNAGFLCCVMIFYDLSDCIINIGLHLVNGDRLSI